MTVGGAVHISTLGSTGGTETELILGSVPSLEPKLQELIQLRERLEQRLESIDSELEQLRARVKNLTPAAAERKTELMFERGPIEQQAQKCDDSIQAIRDKIQAVSTVHLNVTRCINAGVTITVGDASYSIDKEIPGPVSILRARDGSIVYRIGDSGTNKPINTISSFRIAA